MACQLVGLAAALALLSKRTAAVAPGEDNAAVIDIGAGGGSLLELAAGSNAAAADVKSAVTQKAATTGTSGVANAAGSERRKSLMRQEQAEVQAEGTPSLAWEVQQNASGITDLGNMGDYKCANRGETCTCPGIPGRVYFGAGKRWLAMDTERTNQIMCHEKTFGAVPVGLEAEDTNCFCCNSTALCPERIE